MLSLAVRMPHNPVPYDASDVLFNDRSTWFFLLPFQAVDVEPAIIWAPMTSNQKGARDGGREDRGEISWFHGCQGWTILKADVPDDTAAQPALPAHHCDSPQFVDVVSRATRHEGAGQPTDKHFGKIEEDEYRVRIDHADGGPSVSRRVRVFCGIRSSVTNR